MNVENFRVELSLGHKKANLTAHRGSHLVDGVKHLDPRDVSEKP